MQQQLILTSFLQQRAVLAVLIIVIISSLAAIIIATSGRKQNNTQMEVAPHPSTVDIRTFVPAALRLLHCFAFTQSPHQAQTIHKTTQTNTD